MGSPNAMPNKMCLSLESVCTMLFAVDIPECQKGLGQAGVLGLVKPLVELGDAEEGQWPERV